MNWARRTAVVKANDARCEVVAGDASSRQYFRARWPGGSCILVSSPPSTEKNPEFLARRDQFDDLGVRVPAVLDQDLDKGFFALEDLGDELLLANISTDNAEEQYRKAFSILMRLAHWSTDALPDMPRYDRDLLAEELSRFPEWFVQRQLGLSLGAADRSVLGALTELLINSALEQPVVLVHRDFHSRNLMCQADGSLAVIDFQDAVAGPVTYDLVSLLRDCYLRWPAVRVEQWALSFRADLIVAGQLDGVSEAQFLAWFDLMGLQRHLKVLGTFARLSLRDGKRAYLGDIPRVFDYVLEVSAAHSCDSSPMADFRQWCEGRLTGAVNAVEWRAP